MDEFLKQIAIVSAEGGASFTYAEFTLSLLLSFTLGIAISFVYRWTHSGVSYSRSFSVAMILMSVTISFIMLIIGSNLARAFSLVGALSIIRYRNAVRESRDTAFIFLSMAIGMACGVRLYGYAVVFTALASGMVFALDRLEFGTVRREERLLRFAFPDGTVEAEAVEHELQKLSPGRWALLSSEAAGESQVMTYSIELAREKTSAALLKKLAKRFEKSEVKLLTGFETFNI